MNQQPPKEDQNEATNVDQNNISKIPLNKAIDIGPKENPGNLNRNIVDSCKEDDGSNNCSNETTHDRVLNGYADASTSTNGHHAEGEESTKKIISSSGPLDETPCEEATNHVDGNTGKIANGLEDDTTGKHLVNGHTDIGNGQQGDSLTTADGGKTNLDIPSESTSTSVSVDSREYVSSTRDDRLADNASSVDDNISYEETDVGKYDELDLCADLEIIMKDPAPAPAPAQEQSVADHVIRPPAIGQTPA